ncbi:hypothetical protein [Pseudomonas sp. Xaverov 259]|uniref:hypothetical protein n=1 Tax=Pseudomonas sp. Xaverov 259 TaxID=2666086 RepID=UPI001C5AA8AB|nr:hypothetical protein [Pseudomonas sp. Xaverov 259]
MTLIKERPILFSAPMVRAILEGRKTVTRLPVKGAASKWLIDFTPEFVADRANDLCPHGQPGDRLWVRETFIDLRGTGVEHRPDPGGPLQRYAYAADCRPGSHSDEARKDFGLKYKPSIHMPRAACRILLEITDVRVERLQDISTEQIIAEGLSTALREHDAEVDLRRQWRDLWESTGGDWEANQWVWVVEFKRVTP